MTMTGNLLEKGGYIMIGKTQRKILALHDNGIRIKITYRDGSNRLRDKLIGYNEIVRVG
jgi:hypothetical protein